MNIPRQIIFLNGMSRNGISLIHQCLMGHPQIALYPARFKLACSRPHFWPCSESRLTAEQFFEGMVAKHDVEDGEDWQSICCTPLATALAPHLATMKEDFFRKTGGAEKMLHRTDFPAARHTLMEIIFAQRAQQGYLCQETATHLLFSDDHAFNAPPAITDNILGKEALYIQIVRSFPDVLASRKALLLRYLAWQDDPKAKTLRAPAIYSEFIRWLWSLACAAQNHREAPERYILVGFEAFRNDLEGVARQLAKSLGIPFTPSMATPDAGHCQQKKTSMSLVVPTMTTVCPSKVTPNRTGGHVHVLNDEEMAILHSFSPWPQAHTDAPDFARKLVEEFDQHKDQWLRTASLAHLQQLYAAGKAEQGMAHYSTWNHGYGERLTAFV